MDHLPLLHPGALDRRVEPLVVHLLLLQHHAHNKKHNYDKIRTRVHKCLFVSACTRASASVIHMYICVRVRACAFVLVTLYLCMCLCACVSVCVCARVCE